MLEHASSLPGADPTVINPEFERHQALLAVAAAAYDAVDRNQGMTAQNPRIGGPDFDLTKVFGETYIYEDASNTYMHIRASDEHTADGLVRLLVSTATPASYPRAGKGILRRKRMSATRPSFGRTTNIAMQYSPSTGIVEVMGGEPSIIDIEAEFDGVKPVAAYAGLAQALEMSAPNSEDGFRAALIQAGEANVEDLSSLLLEPGTGPAVVRHQLARTAAQLRYVEAAEVQKLQDTTGQEFPPELKVIMGIAALKLDEAATKAGVTPPSRQSPR